MAKYKLKMKKAYCQSCGDELTFKGADLINNSLYCGLDKADCGIHEMIRLFSENIGTYSISKRNCNSRLIGVLNKQEIQKTLLKNDEIQYSFPTFLLRE